MIRNHKMICGCGWRGSEEKILTALNPFDSKDVLQGCPKCKSVNTLEVACDEPDCWRKATCGTPTLSGYKQTCGYHVPQDVMTKNTRRKPCHFSGSG